MHGKVTPHVLTAKEKIKTSELSHRGVFITIDTIISAAGEVGLECIIVPRKKPKTTKKKSASTQTTTTTGALAAVEGGRGRGGHLE
jgi:hypothetical protein